MQYGTVFTHPGTHRLLRHRRTDAQTPQPRANYFRQAIRTTTPTTKIRAWHLTMLQDSLQKGRMESHQTLREVIKELIKVTENKLKEISGHVDRRLNEGLKNDSDLYRYRKTLSVN